MTIKQIKKLYSNYSFKEKKEIFGLIKIIESKKLTNKQKIKLLKKKNYE
jgi:hypothetical protein